MRNSMQTVGAAILVASLVFSSAFAAGTSDRSGPLASGKPAGVKQAQMHGTWMWWLGAAAVVGGGVAIVSSGNGNNGITTTTTTSTSP